MEQPRRFGELAQALGTALKQRQATLATAESCTGGWIAQVITSVPGSSHWFDRGFVTYTNRSKQDMLKVDTATLSQHGAVSEAVVREMAEGALRHSEAAYALAVSGIAGPGGGTTEKPVGMVCFAWSAVGRPTYTDTKRFNGDREAVRAHAVVYALEGLLTFLES